MRRLVAFCGGLALSAGMAYADLAPTPLNLTNFHRASDVIVIGGTSRTISWNVGTGSKIRCVQNPSNQTEDLFLDFTGPASTTPGVSFDLIPGGTPFCMGGAGMFTGSWWVNAATSGHPYIAFEGQ